MTGLQTAADSRNKFLNAKQVPEATNRRIGGSRGFLNECRENLPRRNGKATVTTVIPTDGHMSDEPER
jgi:hypothetical protein